MLQRDYILRLIEQFAFLLRQLVSHKREERYEQALTAIQQGYRTFAGCDPSLIDAQSADQIVDLVRSGVISVDQCLIIARLLAEEADILARSERDYSLETANRSRKSLEICAGIFDHDWASNLESPYAAVESAIRHVDLSSLSEEQKFPLARLLEHLGRYAKAEDLWFDLLDSAEFEAQVLDQAVAFLARLMQKTDAQLLAGELPREEVQEALAELTSRRKV